MTMLDTLERRRRNLRIGLFIIILATLPFYCAGFLLWGTAPSRRAEATSAPLATFTPLGREQPATRTPQVFNIATSTGLSPLQPTPLQFNPGNYVPPSGGNNGGPVVLPPTQYIPPPVIPTSTLAPSLTPYPTNPPPPTAVPPTNTPLPFPTDIPPTDVPPPTETPLPTDAPPTDAPPTQEQVAPPTQGDVQPELPDNPAPATQAGG
jgi:hypothetical protein